MKSLLALTLLLALGACGGGGGSGSGNSATPTPPGTPTTPPTTTPPVNVAPIAVAGADLEVTAGDAVELDGSGSSDSDGEIATYLWQQIAGPEVTLTATDAAATTFEAPVVETDTTLRLELTVTDNSGESSSDELLVTVAPLPVVEPASFTLSGRITAGDSLSRDSDVNNTSASYASNDSFLEAQPISNPVTVGGYINQPQTGSGGRSLISGDLDDVFQVELLAGQTVTMLVSDFTGADADLYLYDIAGEVVDFSVESGEIETVVAPADGTYLVNVFAFSGATNYTLAIGSDATAAGVLRTAIVPGQIVARFKQDTPQATSTMLDRFGLDAGGAGLNRATLLALGQINIGAAALRYRLGSAFDRLHQFGQDRLRETWHTRMTIKSMNKEPGVAYAEPNYLVRSTADVNDEAYPVQWHYDLISVPSAWDLTAGDPELVVAVVDTGILSGHPDLQGQLVPGYDFIRDPRRAGDGDGIDPDPEDNGDGGIDASSFHGTHVAGTIAARTDNVIGVAGVARNVKLMSLRALGIDDGTSYDVAQSVRYAAGLENDSGTVPEKAARVINLSLGGEGFSIQGQDLYRQVREAGVVAVAAAGNESTSTPSYPAAYDGVIAVSATDLQSQRAVYSNFGEWVDVAAPGGDNSQDFNGDGYPDGVLSTAGSDASGSVEYVYTFQNGTSMASPHMAGVVALMLSANPDLTPEDIDALLESGQLSDDLGEPGHDTFFGHGLINARRAVAAALTAAGSTPADNPRLGASTNRLSFGSNLAKLSLNLRNQGSGDLQVGTIEPSTPWLQVDALDIDAQGLGEYRVTVERDGLAPGVYAAHIRVTSNINDLRVAVYLSVSAENTVGNVGYLYVLLVDSQSRESVAQDEGATEGGSFAFNLVDVPAGSYELYAGTDGDNDFEICDPGEACGSYLTIDQPVLIDLQSDTGDIEFPVEYVVTLPGVSGSAAPSPPARAVPRR